MAAQRPGGYFLLSRGIIESDIWFQSPTYVKIWIYLIAKCNYEDGKYLKRGECFITIEEIRQQTKHKSGYRSYGDSTDTIRSALRWLRGNHMVTTRRTTRGTILKVLKYNEYQLLENYFKTTETATGTTRKPHGDRYGNSTDPRSIQKELKKENKKTERGEHAREKNLALPSTPGREKKKGADQATILTILEKGDIIHPVFEALVQGIVSQTNARPADTVGVLKRFASYWLEVDQQGKPRWQKEKTFEVKRRLETWIDKAVKFGELPAEEKYVSPFKNIYEK